MMVKKSTNTSNWNAPIAQRIAEAFAMLLFVLVLAFVLNALGLAGFSSSGAQAATLGGAAIIGLVAASSTCLAATGGLLLSVSASWCKANASASRWTKLQPLLLFNSGRLAAYFLLGGLIGIAGQVLTPSVNALGVLMLIVALVMLWLGLQMLELLPKSLCTIPRHTFIGRHLLRLSSGSGAAGPLLLGALTFFLPCGFTQSMQLTALATGNFWQGGLLMLAFAIGTLPALLGISVLSSALSGNTARFFFRFAGALSIILGVFALKSGLLQTGVDVQGIAARAFGGVAIEAASDPHVTIDAEGRQVISLNISDAGYTPNAITIDAGIPTWVYATAMTPLKGCATFLTAPAFNLSTPIVMGGNWLGPIQNPQKDFVLTCSIGALRADVHVKRS